MGKYSEIVDGAWNDLELYAESVPHLLHQDLTYLWILERSERQRPNSWRIRVEAWKLLVSLFFTGKLKPETVGFGEQPLMGFTSAYGINSVTWLKLPLENGEQRSLPEVVGVLSPTVLVRPMPDFETQGTQWIQDLRAIKSKFHIDDDAVRHFANLAVTRLDTVTGFEYSTRLRKVLMTEFAPAAAGSPQPGRDIVVPLLRRLSWAQRGSAPSDESQKIVGEFPLLVSHPDVATFVPQCTSCNALLLQTREEEPIAVAADAFQMPCLGCGAANTLPLSSFLVWLRDANRAVVWQPETEFKPLKMQVPPSPKISGIELQYEWNVGMAGGNTTRRYLKLRFPGRSITSARVSEVFFPKLLVLGAMENFSGVPVRPEWNDAIDPQGMSHRCIADPPSVDIENITVRGWPVPVSRNVRRFQIVQAPQVSLGIYPSPDIVGTEWKWYRAFLDGASGDPTPYSLAAPQPLNALPTIATSTTGLPHVVSVRADRDADLGSSYYPRSERIPPTPNEGGYVALDFGTTNSIVYYKPASLNLTEPPEPDTHAVPPRDFNKCIRWLADGGGWQNAETIGGFLPGPAYRRDATDPYIVPSTVWDLGDPTGVLIRWNGKMPWPASQRVSTGFKWDPEGSGGRFQPLRLAYVKELLLLSLPHVAQQCGALSDLTVGVSFPLAFSYADRQNYTKLLESVATEIKAVTSISVKRTFSISESHACVRAFGTFLVGETFVVADMGGGTTDVALFTIESPQSKIHQIGSVRYAGESFIMAIARCQPTSGLPLDTIAQTVRDSTANGHSDRDFGSDAATEETLTRFTTLAFELIRTMIAAHRQLVPDTKTVKVILVGNGWQVASLFSRRRSQDGDERTMRATYEHLISLMGEKDVELYTGGLALTARSKHLVAMGALKNALQTQAVQLNRTMGSKMPAGRELDIARTRFAWSDLVGGDITLDGVEQVDGEQIDFNLLTMAPITDTWHRRLWNVLNVTAEDQMYPDKAVLRDQLKISITQNPPKLERGPFQLILENHWGRRLHIRGRE